jgi:hypothetical protein
MLLARYGYLPATDDDAFEDKSKANGPVKAFEMWRIAPVSQ